MLFKKIKRVPYHVKTIKSQLFESKIPLLLRTTSALSILSGTLSGIITVQLLISGLISSTSIQETSGDPSNAFAGLIEMFSWLLYLVFIAFLGLLVAALLLTTLCCFTAALDLLNLKRSGVPKVLFSQLAILSAAAFYVAIDPTAPLSLASLQQPANSLQTLYNSTLFYHYRIGPWIVIVSTIICLLRPNIRRALKSEGP